MEGPDKGKLPLYPGELSLSSRVSYRRLSEDILQGFSPTSQDTHNLTDSLGP